MIFSHFEQSPSRLEISMFSTLRQINLEEFLLQPFFQIDRPARICIRKDELLSKLVHLERPTSGNSFFCVRKNIIFRNWQREMFWIFIKLFLKKIVLFPFFSLPKNLSHLPPSYSAKCDMCQDQKGSLSEWMLWKLLHWEMVKPLAFLI